MSNRMRLYTRYRRIAVYYIVSSGHRAKYVRIQNSYWKCRIGYGKIKENIGECVWRLAAEKKDFMTRYHG